MSDEITNYPLAWPAGKPRTPARQRKRAAFGRNVKSDRGWTSKKPLTVAQALDRLFSELRATRGINANLAVVSTNVRTRNDGLPYSNAAEPDDPGVAVYFKLDGEPHCLPCDRWDRVADNIGAIAKHIDAMRGQARWGVGDLRTHFAGFKSLPPGGSAVVQTAMTVEAAARFMNQAAGCPTVDRDLIQVPANMKLAYHRAASRLHPDRGGDAEQFKLLQEAKRVLDQHHDREGLR